MAGSQTKRTGDILELEFAAECMRKGAVVSKPLGDNAHYDLLVDSGKRIYRVQVKSASRNSNGRSHSVNITRKLPKMRPGDSGGSSKAVPYKTGEIDCIVTKADGQWFFFDEFASDKSVYPAAGRDEYTGNRGKERCELLGL